MTRFQDFLLNYSFTPVPTDQLDYLYFGKGCAHRVLTLMLTSASPWPPLSKSIALPSSCSLVSHTSTVSLLGWWCRGGHCDLCGGQPGGARDTSCVRRPWDTLLPFLGKHTKKWAKKWPVCVCVCVRVMSEGQGITGPYTDMYKSEWTMSSVSRTRHPKEHHHPLWARCWTGRHNAKHEFSQKCICRLSSPTCR